MENQAIVLRKKMDNAHDLITNQNPDLYNKVIKDVREFYFKDNNLASLSNKNGKTIAVHIRCRMRGKTRDSDPDSDAPTEDASAAGPTDLQTQLSSNY